MKRDLETIRNTQFDLLVIGGGIQGAAICFKAAQRGLKVALLEKNDFCSSSSANSLKILHGGLRYLQTLDFRRMRDSIRSRRELMQLAPHLVVPLPCAMPAYGHGLKGKEVMRVAMAMNDVISIDRNKDVPLEKQLPAGHILSKAQCLQQIPGISGQSLHGASVWYDALAINTERLVFEYILRASELGATCVNYLSVGSLHRHADGHIEAQLCDHLNGQQLTMRAKVVINSAGAAYEDLIPDANVLPAATRWARGLNIVVRKNLFPGGAVALEKKMGGRKRMLFMVPWREKYTMIGTHYIEKPRRDELFPVEEKDIMALLEEMNVIYPPAELTFEDVSFYHAGLLPMHGNSKTSDPSQPELSKESSIIDHGQVDGFSHFYSIKGIKYTTAPQVADKILKRLFGCENGSNEPARDARALSSGLAGGEHDDYLVKKYARHAGTVRPYITTSAKWLDADHSLLSGEVDYFIEEEMALHLSDVVFRRSALGTAECPSLQVLESINQLMADHFKWSDEQRAAELKQVLRRYAPLKIAH